MKVFVTGGAGFIGSHLVDALIERGDDVIVIDDLTSGSLKNLNSSAKFHKLSVCDPELKQLFETERPELVFHLAAQTSVGKSVVDSGFDAQINILGGLNLISSCATMGVRKIVYASSSAIYGHPDHLPVDESHVSRPLSPYGISKHTLERYLHVFHKLFGVSYTILRYSNVYGPRQNPSGEGGVVAIFSNKMLSGKRPVIFGDGTKTRDYVFVTDVVAANLSAARYEESDTFNIGTGIETTDKMAFELISRACHYDKGFEFAGDRPGDIKHLFLNCSKAQRLLGWNPQVELENGISNTVDYYRRLFQ